MADEILAEMRRIKEELAARFDHDLAELFRFLKQRERNSGRPAVNLTKRPRRRAPARIRV